MAISSVGYDGTVDEAQWASMVSKVGGYEYGVDKAGDFAVTQSAGTRMVSIAPGVAWGRGVLDVSDTLVVVQLDAVTTGTRYDLIALRRSWGPANGGPSELVVIKGTSARALPPGRMSSPGVTDDQPLALVRVQAGSSSLPEVLDLRVWGRNGGQLFARNDLVRTYLNTEGTEINVQGALWARTVASNGVAQWERYGTRNDSGWVRPSVSGASGWRLDYLRYRVKDGVCQLALSAVRTGADIPSTPSGNIANILLATAPGAARPMSWWAPLTSGPAGRMVAGYVEVESGKIYLTATTAQFIAKGEEIQLSGHYFLD